MAERYPADSTVSTENDEGKEETDSPIDLNQPGSPPVSTAPAFTKQERDPGQASQMVPGTTHHLAGAQNDVLEKETKCFLLTPIGEAPHMEELKTMLKILLDPPRPLGGDIKSLASAFGYNNNKIHFLTSKNYGSPTEDLLQAEGHNSIKFLLDKLTFIGREDAAGKVRDYISSKNCKCEGCRKTLC